MAAKRLIINFLLILAVVTVGISPACHFIGGTMAVMEICTGQGVQKMAVAADRYALPGAQQDRDRGDHAAAKQPCAFCFATAHLTGHATFAAMTQPPGGAAFSAPWVMKRAAAAATLYRADRARAPPYPLV
jgi:hypothetical protein